jgi:hypothetical protein
MINSRVKSAPVSPLSSLLAKLSHSPVDGVYFVSILVTSLIAFLITRALEPFQAPSAIHLRSAVSKVLDIFIYFYNFRDVDELANVACFSTFQEMMALNLSFSQIHDF